MTMPMVIQSARPLNAATRASVISGFEAKAGISVEGLALSFFLFFSSFLEVFGGSRGSLEDIVRVSVGGGESLPKNLERIGVESRDKS